MTGDFQSILMNVGLTHYLILATILFSIGLFGVITSRNVIRVLMCVELMLNAVNINLVAFNNSLNPDVLGGQVFAIFVLTISAAEAAVGLACHAVAALGHQNVATSTTTTVRKVSRPSPRGRRGPSICRIS